MDIFKLSLEFLPQLKTFLEPIAKRSSLTAEEGIVLVIIVEQKEAAELLNSEIIDSLISKGVLNSDLSLSSKGSIVAKSVISAKKKFSETIAI